MFLQDQGHRRHVLHLPQYLSLCILIDHRNGQMPAARRAPYAANVIGVYPLPRLIQIHRRMKFFLRRNRNKQAKDSQYCT